MAKKPVGRGRPEKFAGAGYILAFKAVVKKYGLVAGAKYITENGVVVGGVHREVTITPPTLSKYISRETSKSKPLELKRGRPAKAA